MSVNIQFIDSKPDSWEKFMILWGSTPEIFIGSCIASLMGIVITWYVTRHVSRSNGAEQARRQTMKEHENTIALARNEREDDGEKQTDHQEIGDDVSVRTCKKTLYKFASKELEKSLTNEQINEEKETKRKQLEAIYNLMKDQKDLFGIENLNQVEEQMKLYG